MPYYNIRRWIWRVKETASEVYGIMTAYADSEFDGAHLQCQSVGWDGGNLP